MGQRLLRAAPVILVCGWALGTRVAAAPTSKTSKQTSKDCQSCHPKIWRQWRTSRHAQSGGPLFQHEFRHKPSAWCLGCHAPATRLGVSTAQALSRGVDCSSCHMRAGRLTARSRSAQSPHRTRVDKDFGRPKDCARCHDFNFPRVDSHGKLYGQTGQAMQKTVREFRSSPANARGKQCTHCHMPASRPHSFPGGFSRTMVNRALAIELCTGEQDITVTLRSRLAGHNLPTGGVHRAIEIRLWTPDHPERSQSYRLQRLVAGQPGKRRVYRDTTLTARGRHQWKVSKHRLSLYPFTELELNVRYLIGTAPTPHRPHTTLPLRHDKFTLATLPRCQ